MPFVYSNHILRRTRCFVARFIDQWCFQAKSSMHQRHRHHHYQYHQHHHQHHHQHRHQHHTDRHYFHHRRQCRCRHRQESCNSFVVIVRNTRRGLHHDDAAAAAAAAVSPSSFLSSSSSEDGRTESLTSCTLRTVYTLYQGPVHLQSAALISFFFSFKFFSQPEHIVVSV